MAKHLLVIMVTLVISGLTVFSGVLPSQAAMALSDQDTIKGNLCDKSSSFALEGCGSGADGGSGDLVASIIETLLVVIGAVSVLVLIVGAIRFVVSGGDAQAVQSARNQILYALIGVALSFSAFAIARFAVGRFL